MLSCESRNRCDLRRANKSRLSRSVSVRCKRKVGGDLQGEPTFCLQRPAAALQLSRSSVAGGVRTPKPQKDRAIGGKRHPRQHSAQTSSHDSTVSPVTPLHKSSSSGGANGRSATAVCGWGDRKACVPQRNRRVGQCRTTHWPEPEVQRQLRFQKRTRATSNRAGRRRASGSGRSANPKTKWSLVQSERDPTHPEPQSHRCQILGVQSIAAGSKTQ